MLISLKCFRLSSRRSRVIIFGFLVVFVMTQYYSDIINNYFLESNKILTGEKTAENSLRRYLINTSGCRIPYINPFDKTVLKYYKYVPPHMCSDRKPLIESNQTSIRIVKSELENYHVKNVKELLCGYVEFSVNNKIQQQQQQVKKSYDYGLEILLLLLIL